MRMADYLRTRFARFLILQATPTQNISKGCFVFLPVPDLRSPVDDASLYGRYGLSDEDVSYIESIIKPFPLGADDDR